MSDFERAVDVHLLPYGSTSPAAFEKRHLNLDPMRHTCSAIKELVGVRGFITHNATIVPDEALLKNWHDAQAPIVIVASSPDWEESDAWAKNPNQVARLLNAHCPIDCALVALGRCYWQEGFGAFFSAATVLRQLVDSSYTYDYQRRLEAACLTRRDLNPVFPFNEHTGALIPTPRFQGDLTGGLVRGEWVEKPRQQVSTDKRQLVQRDAAELRAVVPSLEASSAAVVRVFGYHAVSDQPGRVDVVPFTAFFVAPGLLMTCRTAAFCDQTNTFAHSFKFTKRLRALHGMLTDGVDLHVCRVVDGLTDTLVNRVRSLGIALDDSKIPPGLFACPWNDLLLLEVVDPRQHSSTILLPEHNTSATLRKGAKLFATSYSRQPDPAWCDTIFGNLGFNAPENNAETMRTQWWSHDTKCVSLGNVLSDQLPDDGMIRHNCSLLPGSRGAPLFHDIGDGDMFTFAGVSSGRSIELMKKEQDSIVTMSTSDLARNESLAANVFNECIPVHHLTMILLYQEVIQHRLTEPNQRLHIRKFLAPFDIFVNRNLLSKCHSTMLLDADDHNEYGMDFYEHHDLGNALACFREGAKMFSTASIPNLSQHDIDLKTALQTNVSAVVVARMNLVQ